MRNLLILIFFLIATILFSEGNREYYWHKIEEENISTIGNISPYDRTILDIYFLPDNPLYGWACGFGGRVYYTRDGGETWTTLIVPEALGNQLEHIMFLNENVGYTSGPGEFGSIFKSTDGGETWNNISPRFQGIPELSIWGHFFITEEKGVALASNGCNDQFFYYTEDGGNSWSFTSEAIFGAKLSDAIILEEDGLGYACGSGYIFETKNGGRTWDILDYLGEDIYEYQGQTERFFNSWQEDITYFNGSILVPTSGGCSGGFGGGMKFRTPDGVIYSTEIKEPFYGTFLTSETSGWAVGHNESVYYTEDSGINWELRNCGITDGKLMDDIYVIDDRTAFVVGDFIYKLGDPPILEVPNIIVDGNFCGDLEVTLEADKEFEEMIWKNKETGEILGFGSSVTIYEEGVYTIEVRDLFVCDTVREAIPVDIFASSEEEIAITQSPEGPYCEGDEVVLEVEGNFTTFLWNTGEITPIITVTESGEYIIEAIDANGCKKKDTIDIYIEPNPKPNVWHNEDFQLCANESLALLSDEGYDRYEWYLIDENEESLFAETRVTETDRSGEYFLITYTPNGCINYSDTLSLEFEFVEDVLDISILGAIDYLDAGKVIYPNQKCLEVEITNKSNQFEYMIDNPYLYYNTEFSVPQSTLPISIAPGQTIDILICFTPQKIGIARDTLLLEDFCSKLLLPMQGEGELNDYSSTTRCELPIFFDSQELIGSNAISYPYPNPANSQLSIDFTYEFGEGFDLADSEAILYNNFGKQQIKVNPDYIQEFTDKNDKLNFGRFVIDTKDIPNGSYYVNVKVGSMIKSYPVMINK